VHGKFIKIVFLNIAIKELVIYCVRYSEFVCDIIALLCIVCLTYLDYEHISCFGTSRWLQALYVIKLHALGHDKGALYFTRSESDQYYIY